VSLLRLILASLAYHWRMNLAVALGAAAGTAVLSGALLVGDSMRGSLRELTLDRLGRIDQVLLTGRFFRSRLAEELSDEPQFKQHFSAAVPGILLRASLQNADPQAPRRANRVNLLGCDERFWRLGSGGPVQLPEARQIVLNRPLADRLGVETGQEVLLRLPGAGPIPADSPLGRKSGTVRTVRLAVGQIIPAEGLGRFSLRPSQQLPLNAYVRLESLQHWLDRPGKVNAILVAGRQGEAEPPQQAEALVQRLLRPAPADYGLTVEKTRRGYFNITSHRMLLDPATERAILKALAGDQLQPALTYLANTIACGDREIPYSTVSAVDFLDKPPLGPLVSVGGGPIPPIADGQIVLNSWAAEQLGAKPGDTIRLTYFEPESTRGQLRENTVELKLAAVAKLAGAADDRDFTPKVPGVTDQLTMADWDPPFPFDAKRIGGRDETYWDDHGPTPKAFVSLATGRKLWGSRFGRVTSIRVRPVEGMTVESIEDKLDLDPAALGFVFQPVKRQGLAASAGATPFDVLFLCFSFFIIAAAVMLVALLFGLGIDRRAEELGILTAVGFTRLKIAAVLAAEGLLVAVFGGLIGTAAAVGYAALMLLGLRTWWLAAVITPLLRLHVTTASLVIGFVGGVSVAVLAIVSSVWRTRRVAPRQLLCGSTTGTIARPAAGLHWSGTLAVVALVAAGAFGVAAGRIGEEMRAGAFFGVGAVVLLACLTLVWACLRSGSTGAAVAAGRGNLLRMALRNAARNPGRSALSIGLVASACFLIVAVSAFHLDPAGQLPALHSGNGGFALVAESDQPIYRDLNTAEGRAQLGFSPADSRLLAGCTIIALRVKPGDDATCLNLYRPRQPRVLGVSKELIDRGGFAWADSAASTPAEKENAWLLLQQPLRTDAGVAGPAPVVIEKNTAAYMLHLYRGIGETYRIADDSGRAAVLKVVALLAGSVFQGDLLIGEEDFKRFFPGLSGYRFFLIETDRRKTAAVQNALERTLGDYGLSTETTGRRLGRFLAVQNTYLSTFQSLGGLGLLLGTFALAAVQLRNVFERRGELALLRAAGFRRRTLAALVMLENSLLLLAGLGVGVAAAMVAVLPHLLSRAASVPFLSLAATLLLVLAVGLLAGLAAVRAALRAPLLPALQQE